MSKAQAARTFGVGATSVKRYVKLAEEGKPLTPGKAPDVEELAAIAARHVTRIVGPPVGMED